MDRISFVGRGFACGIVLGLLVLWLPTVGAEPTGPITNGDFDLPPVTRTVEIALEGSPVDRCVGVGHQVLYGSQTPQAEATGGPVGEPDAEQADPIGALGSVLADPGGTADGQTACSWNSGQGQDLAFLNPAEAVMTPAGWTYDLQSPAVEFGYGFDSDVTDRETRVLDNTSRSDRNLWQSFTPKQQAFTPDAEALEMTIERGAISDRADVELVLEPTSPEALANDQLRECVLTFDATQLQAALAEGDEGHLAADPVDADFDARSESCAHLETAWKDPDATADDRREVLAQTRIVEISLWYWNHADEPTVIDDVHLTGARLVAEEHAPVSV